MLKPFPSFQSSVPQPHDMCFLSYLSLFDSIEPSLLSLLFSLSAT